MIKTGFLKKEIKELVKTPKLIVIASLFVFFAILSPLGAKYINEILSAVGGGIEIKFPEPVLLDAWIQFFKNNNSIGMIVFLIMTTGTVVSEKTKGSVMMVLSKNVSRAEFILCKTAAAILLFTVGYILAALVCAYYTSILFAGQDSGGLLSALCLFWLLGVFYAALAVFSSVVAKTPTTAAIIGIAGYAAFNIPLAIPGTAKYTPASLSAVGTGLISGTMESAEILITVLITAALCALFVLSSVYIFRRQEI